MRKIGIPEIEDIATGAALLDAEELAERELQVGQPLPWQHLDMGVTQEYLAAELQRSERGKFTPKCFDGCRRCGVCRE